MDFMYSKLVASATEESLQRLEKKQNIISTKSSPQSKQCIINVDYRRSYTEEACYESEASIESQELTLIRMKKNLTAKFRRLLKRGGGDISEKEPLISRRTQLNKKPFISRDKLKTVGKRLRKAVESSLSYMAAGMATDVMTASLLSGYLPNPAHYCSNYDYNYSY